MTDTLEQCIHHWRCAPVTGPTSDAICKNCGAQRVFSNLLPYEPLGWHGIDDSRGWGASARAYRTGRSSGP